VVRRIAGGAHFQYVGIETKSRSDIKRQNQDVLLVLKPRLQGDGWFAAIVDIKVFLRRYYEHFYGSRQQ
jgi:hypothetical protein